MNGSYSAGRALQPKAAREVTPRPKAAPLTAVPTVCSEPMFQLDGVTGPLTAAHAVHQDAELGVRQTIVRLGARLQAPDIQSKNMTVLGHAA
jgi:hypothetical protein